jgi:aspartate 1-decarboxylase
MSRGNAVTLVYSGLRNGSCSLDDIPQRTEGLLRFVPVLVFSRNEGERFQSCCTDSQTRSKIAIEFGEGSEENSIQWVQGTAPLGHEGDHSAASIA